MNYFELATFIAYFVFVVGVGVFFFVRSKDKGEKDYFLGGRQMNGLVAAFSAGASDMSAWVLLGLPGSICLYGLGQIWISIGLLIGTICAWIFVAPRLRRYAILADDAIAVPQFLSNRFRAKGSALRIICAVIFVIAYCIYAASSISACGDLFSTIIPGFDKKIAMVVAAVVIGVYTMLGGFKAVCWTDFFQGLLMLGALLIVPIVALAIVKTSGPVAAVETTEHYYNLLSGGAFNWKSISDILTGLGWGLGYFGMPHILVRYMSIKSEAEMKKSRVIGITWIAIILTMATVLGVVGHMYLGNTVDKSNSSLMFVRVVRSIFGAGALALLGGLLLSAIVAAAMSTADSQLLASSSAFSSDIYRTAIRKKASDKEMLLVGRLAVVVILGIALLIALNPKSSSIMQLVSAAWSLFGAAFGPAILLSLFWRRFNYRGVCAGILTGFVVAILWMVLFNFEYYGFTSVVYNTGLYEIVPGFLSGLAVSVTVSLATKAPDDEITAVFDAARFPVDEDETTEDVADLPPAETAGDESAAQEAPTDEE